MYIGAFYSRSILAQWLRPQYVREWGLGDVIPLGGPVTLTRISVSLSLRAPQHVDDQQSQREGVQFMYQCVMGLKDYKGKGWYVGARFICDTFQVFLHQPRPR